MNEAAPRSAVVLLAPGTEEMEAVICIDVLRRAGWGVDVVGTAPGPLRMSRGVLLVADRVLDETPLPPCDVLVVPGGVGGVDALARDDRVLAAVRRQHAEGRWLAAICAGPLVLQAAGLLEGRSVTCHPGVADRLTSTVRRGERVVVDGRLVTSQGPGTALDFALRLVAELDGPDRMAEVAGPLLHYFRFSE